MGARDHRLVDDGDRRVRPLAARQRELRLREGLAHEQLVVHGRDASRRDVGRRRVSGPAVPPIPSRNRSGLVRRGRMTAAMTTTSPTDRDPDRRRRRPGPQRRHQERRLPGDRGRLHGPRDPPRLGGPDPRPARRRARSATTSGRSTGPTPGRSTGPAGRSSTRRGRTRGRCAQAGLAAVDGRRRSEPATRSSDGTSTT